MGTATTSFGTGKRENHDSSVFYNRNIYKNSQSSSIDAEENITNEPVLMMENWQDNICCQSSENMPLPNNSIGLVFTSPPYNVGKDYEDDITLDNYLSLIRNVGKEVYRVLKTGGRYVINVANLGRKPYIPLHSLFYQIHQEIGFLPMGEIIWQKGKGANGSCAWGSWRNARAPRLRDLHEYLLVFAKEDFSRIDKGESTISAKEFMKATLSIWQIPPASAKKIGHPAPFPVELAARVIKLYSYIGDVVLDPFMGSGTTCVSAKQLKRHYIGFDISKHYCELAKTRLVSETEIAQLKKRKAIVKRKNKRD